MTGKTEEQAQVILENHIAKRIKTESSSNAQDFESRSLPSQFKNPKQLAELVNIAMDQLKDTNTRDTNPETPEDLYLPDTDDMAKIMSMPFEVQKALLKIKKDPKVVFNPEARKALAFLILSYYQRKSNNQPKDGFLNITDQMTERKGYSLELNVMHGRLPRQKESKTAWGSTGKVPSMMSYILGAHFKKILPHFTEEMAKIPQGTPRASSANWYKTAQRTSEYACVMLFRDDDVYNMRDNIEAKSKKNSSINMKMPFTKIVPFEVFGTMEKVISFRKENKDMKALVVTWQEAEIFAELGLLDLKGITDDSKR
jgi:hypothetical protein